VTKLSDQLDAIRKPTRPTLRQWLKTLNAEDSIEFEKAATDTDFSTATLTAFFKEKGVATSKDTVSAWRSGHGFTR